MTVEQLVEMLQYLPRDMEVMFSYPSGDYIGSEICGEISVASETSVMKSDYHYTWKLYDEEKYGSDEAETYKNIVVLR